MSIPEQNDSLVPGDEIGRDERHYPFVLALLILCFAVSGGMSVLSFLSILGLLGEASLSAGVAASSALLAVPGAVVFGWLVFDLARSHYLGERLVVGVDRIQWVLGQTVKGELLFENVCDVKLVEVESDSGTEKTVGLWLKDPTQMPVMWPDIGFSLTARLERWVNYRRYKCDLTVGWGWQKPGNDIHELVLRRWEAFRSQKKR